VWYDVLSDDLGVPLPLLIYSRGQGLHGKSPS